MRNYIAYVVKPRKMCVCIVTTTITRVSFVCELVFSSDGVDNELKTYFKYVSSLNNYRLASICKPYGYLRTYPNMYMHH